MAINRDKMTLKVQEALVESSQISQDGNNQTIELPHLLLALVKQKDGIVSPILAKLGVDLNQFSEQIELELTNMPKVYGVSVQPILNQEVSKLFDRAEIYSARVSKPHRRYHYFSSIIIG